MTRSLLASIDLGTTQTRALIVDATGATLGEGQRPLGITFPRPGWVEQDPEALLQASVEALQAAIGIAQCDASDIAGLGIVTQRATAIAWNRVTGAPLAPAIGWQDQRTQERVDALVARGIPISTQPSATKFEWLLTQVPAVAAAARSGELVLGTPDAWLAARLGDLARPQTDPSEASATALFDLRTGDWNDDLLALFGIERAWLPEIVPTTSVCGESSSHWFGSPIPLAARAGDQQSACYAQGVRKPQDAKLTLGTAAMLDVHTGHLLQKPPPGAYPLALWKHGDDPLEFCLEGAVITAGASIEWLVQIGILDSVENLDALAGSVPDAAGVQFVPALQGLGTPFADPLARGFIGGLTRGTTRAHLARASVEGIAQRCVDVCEALVPAGQPIRIDGGLARCELLLQSLADLSERSLHRAGEIESTALGGAALAARATSGIQKFTGPARAMRIFDPSQGSSSWRGEARERWHKALTRAAEAPLAMR